MKKRIFAIGDIHGCYNAFRTMVEQNIQIKKSDTLILLGDYIDRGTHSKEVVDYIINLQKEGFDIVPLKGNHEEMLLDAFENIEFLSKWIQNGGDKTLNSFGISTLNNINPGYIDFLNGLNCYCAIEDYLFVHAGFNDEAVNPFSDKYFMLWECKKEFKNQSLKNKTVIHGHCPISVALCKESVLSNSNDINLDTGCVYSDKDGYGTLTALELTTKNLYFV